MITAEQETIIAQADAVCAADPYAKAVRDELLFIERFMTSDGQWQPFNPRSTVYQLFRETATGTVKSAPLEILSVGLQHAARKLDGNVPYAFALLAAGFGNPDDVPPMFRDATSQAAIREALTENPVPDGWELVGLGVASEAMSVNGDSDEATAILERCAETGRFDHPDVLPVWYTKAVTTDARQWDVIRQQGSRPVYSTFGPDDVPLNDHLDHMVDALNKFLTSMVEILR